MSYYGDGAFYHMQVKRHEQSFSGYSNLHGWELDLSEILTAYSYNLPAQASLEIPVRIRAAKESR